MSIQEGWIDVRANHGPAGARRWLRRWFAIDRKNWVLRRYHDAFECESEDKTTAEGRVYKFSSMVAVREELSPRVYIDLKSGDTLKLRAEDKLGQLKWYNALRLSLESYRRAKKAGLTGESDDEFEPAEAEDDAEFKPAHDLAVPMGGYAEGVRTTSGEGGGGDHGGTATATATATATPGGGRDAWGTPPMHKRAAPSGRLS
jgi:hypothetical protein